MQYCPSRLLGEIGSAKEAKEVTLRTLQNLIGNNVGQKVWDFYQKQVVEDEEAGAVEVEPGDGAEGEE